MSIPQLHEALPAWLSCPPTSTLIELATKCLEAIVVATEDAAHTTETCVSLLLDLVRISMNFPAYVCTG